jgi:hypothetical protein
MVVEAEDRPQRASPPRKEEPLRFILHARLEEEVLFIPRAIKRPSDILDRQLEDRHVESDTVRIQP